MISIIVTAFVSVAVTVCALYKLGVLRTKNQGKSAEFEHETLFFTCWDPVSDEKKARFRKIS